MDNLRIVRDTREKVDFWDFSYAGHDMIDSALKSGDYSLEGYEDQISIERKKSTGELSGNLGIKIKQFRNELERLRSYKVKYVLCEFSISDVLNFPQNSGIPKKLWSKLRMSGAYMSKLIQELSDEYDIIFLFCDDKTCAEETAIQIFKEFIDKYGKSN